MGHIHMDEKTKKWVRKNGNTVALYPFYLFNLKKQKGLVDVIVTNEVPTKTVHDMVFTHVDGIDVYIHQNIQAKRVLKLQVTGFGPFEHLRCCGTKRFRRKQEPLEI